MSVLAERADDIQGERKFTENMSPEIYNGECELRESAFNALALLSDPTWISIKERNTVYSTALSEWVQHQRIWIAVDKATIAEIIGSVRGVIPNSKLASYGDFRYDIDLEEMYDILDEMSEENSLTDDWGIAFHNNQKLNPSIQELNISSSKDENESDKTELEWNKLKFDSSVFEEWILKCQSLLRMVRRIVSQEKSFDVWSNVLLKTCSKFLSALRCNASLLKVMEADMPLLTDYRQLLNEPITMLELLSLPQPYLNDNLNIEIEQEDTLWLKLSSPSIKNLWGQKHLSKNSNSSGFDSWLGTTNFLRRQRQKNSIVTSKEDIEIPEREARDLIGSLFNVIEGHGTIKIETTELEDKLGIQMTSKNYFPQAHGDWTRTLFPRRVNGQNETNTIATSSFFHCQTDLQAFGNQIIPLVLPPTFPPPLYVPPPSLSNILLLPSTQKLPFYIPPSNQPLQNYNYEKGHLTLPRNYLISSRSLASDAQQSLPSTPSFSLKQAAGAGFQVKQVSRYYSQSLSNSQTNISSIPPANQVYFNQNSGLTMKPTQFYPTHLACINKSITHHDENFIKEVKSKLLPNISSRISTVNKLSLQARELYQHNSVYSFQQLVNSAKTTKGDFSRMQNTLLPKSTKQFLEHSPKPKKIEETNVSTQYKRTPLVIYNHQRSPVIEKIRKDLSTVRLFKQELSYNPQNILTGKSKQITVKSVEDQKESKEDLLNTKQTENRINCIHLEYSDVSEKFSSRISSSQNPNVHHILLESRNNLSKNVNPNARDKVSYSNNYKNAKTDQMNCKLMHSTKMKLTERKKNLAKRSIRFDQYKIMLLLCKNLKRQGNIIDMDSIHKWIWDYLKLHKRDNYHIKECLEPNKCSIILNYCNKRFAFRMCENNSRRSLKMLKNFSLTRFEIRKNEDQQVISCILYLKAISNTNLNKNSDMFNDDCKSDDQKAKITDLEQSYKMNCNWQNSKNSIEDRKWLNVEFLNMMAENLFSDDEVNTTRSTSFKNGKINGWTYFKIAIEMIVKKASHFL